eukprot:scaffold25841_cov69-Phaeocystis_antarctica.AAC.1
MSSRARACQRAKGVDLSMGARGIGNARAGATGAGLSMSSRAASTTAAVRPSLRRFRSVRRSGSAPCSALPVVNETSVSCCEAAFAASARATARGDERGQKQKTTSGKVASCSCARVALPDAKSGSTPNTSTTSGMRYFLTKRWNRLADRGQPTGRPPSCPLLPLLAFMSLLAASIDMNCPLRPNGHASFAWSTQIASPVSAEPEKQKSRPAAWHASHPSARVEARSSSSGTSSMPSAANESADIAGSASNKSL